MTTTVSRGKATRAGRNAALAVALAGTLTLSVGVVAEASSSHRGSGLPQGDDPVHLKPSDFSATIDNPQWPMTVGSRWVYRVTDMRDGAAKREVITVTRRTTLIADGIRARVVRDVVRDHGDLVFVAEPDYAQDRHGNVWYMGEQTAEFEKGKIVSRAGSWEAGKDGAMPGIMIPAQPQVGQRYRQEYKKGEAEDNGQVLLMNNLVEVKAGQYKGALVTMDTSRIEPDSVEFKFYAPNVGPLLALDVSGGAAREELVKVDKAASTVGTGPMGKPNP